MSGLYRCIVCNKQIVVQEYLARQVKEVEREKEIEMLKTIDPLLKTNHTALIIQALEMCNEKKVYTIPACHGVFRLIHY